MSAWLYYWRTHRADTDLTDTTSPWEKVYERPVAAGDRCRQQGRRGRVGKGLGSLASVPHPVGSSWTARSSVGPRGGELEHR